MLRQLRAGCRNTARHLTSPLLRSPHLPRGLPWQRHYLQSEIRRHGPRTNHYRQNGQGPRRLQARISCSIYISIGFLMLNEALDWDQRMSTAIETVERITHEKNVRRMWSIFYETGQALLATYSGAEVVYHHDAVRVPSKGGWAGELEIKMFTSPDPEVEGGVLVLCLATLGDQMDTYVTVDTNQLTDATEAIIPGVEEFASTLQGSPKVRGAILILQDNGNWKNVYWDGRRWINIIYLEWQTAESMGFVFDRE